MIDDHLSPPFARDTPRRKDKQRSVEKHPELVKKANDKKRRFFIKKRRLHKYWLDNDDNNLEQDDTKFDTKYIFNTHDWELIEHVDYPPTSFQYIRYLYKRIICFVTFT